MVREKISASLLFGAVIVLGMTISSSEAHAEPFDKPLQKKVVDLGQSPELRPSPDSHIKLTCSYYANFMIKELNDPGNKGALWIALVPAKSGHISACTRTHGPEDKVFKDRDGHYWDGYFGGVKRDLVFLFASDGTDGGIPFTAFDSKTQAKIFRDSASIGNSYDGLDFVQASDTQMTLRYLRVVTGTCSIPKDGSACWNKFKEQLGLRLAPVPKCSDEPGKYAGTSPSVIAYPVEASLFPKPSIKAVGNPVRCYPPS
jgi:hypothetical protein